MWSSTSLLEKLIFGFLAAAVIVVILGVSGCFSPTLEYSEPLTENGIALSTLHTTSHTSSSTAIGFTTGGNIAFTPTTVTVPETWGVVFRCDHGNKFAIQGSDAEHHDLWQRLDDAVPVTIQYREVYEVDGDERVLVDYDFMDAWERER